MAYRKGRGNPETITPVAETVDRRERQEKQNVVGAAQVRDVMKP